ncbi:MAG: hypothetical protein II032_04995 [Treponema sp.]|nr:hypothetical protein [Treponema sp.]
MERGSSDSLEFGEPFLLARIRIFIIGFSLLVKIKIIRVVIIKNTIQQMNLKNSVFSSNLKRFLAIGPERKYPAKAAKIGKMRQSVCKSLFVHVL